jgi:hypothetical protein
MNAPPFPLNPSVGEWFQNWVWNGVRWVCSPSAGIRIVVQTIAASGPYMPSPGLTSAQVETWGGGGGGGAALQLAGQVGGGGGGGSGGYSRKTLPAALVMGGVSVIIGDGGAGTGQAADDYSSPGGATSFGAFCIANGGQGGQSNTSAVAWGQGGNGGAPGVGDLTATGAPGLPGFSGVLASGVNVFGGMGGSILGGGGISSLTAAGGSIAGVSGATPGGGGSGGVVDNPTGTTIVGGGNGGGGLCVVTEYCWADSAGDGEDCVNPINARVTIERGDNWQPRPPGRPGGRPFDEGQEFGEEGE